MGEPTRQRPRHKRKKGLARRIGAVDGVSISDAVSRICLAIPSTVARERQAVLVLHIEPELGAYAINDAFKIQGNIRRYGFLAAEDFSEGEERDSQRIGKSCL